MLWYSNPGNGLAWAINSPQDGDDTHSTDLYLPNISVLPNWQLIGYGNKL